MTFGPNDLPPCNGFWSLTAYGMDLYLVENEIDRFSIGDRTPDLHYENDGSLTIILSAQRPEQVCNWLPVRRALHAGDACLRGIPRSSNATGFLHLYLVKRMISV